MKEKYHQILEKVSEFNSYLIAAHPTPDGDAIGATVAFYYFLKHMNKEVTLVLDGYVDSKYDFLLQGIPYTLFPQGTDRPYECFIAFDIGDKRRIKNILEAQEPHKPYLINIDHHPSNRGFGHIDLVDPSASSTGEMVYHVFQAGGISIDPLTATALYGAIASDTGFFCYSNTSPSALKAASELLERGADQEKLTYHLVRSKPLNLFKLEAEYLSHIQFSPNQKILWGVIPRQLCEKYGVSIFQVGDFVEIPRNLEGVMISVLIRDDEKEGQLKLSFRSNDSELDVNVFTNGLGGGGHARAAGCVMEGELHSTAEKVMGDLMAYYQDIKKSAP